MNGMSQGPDARAEVADITLPATLDATMDKPDAIMTDSAQDPALTISTPTLSADPAVQQPTSDVREATESSSSMIQAAEVEEGRNEQDITQDPAVATDLAPTSHSPLRRQPSPAIVAAPASTSDAMDTSDEPIKSIDLPHHPPVPTANGAVPEAPTDPAPTPPPLVSQPYLKRELSPNVGEDTVMRDVPSSPGKAARSREEDTTGDEPATKRMRPTSAGDNEPVFKVPELPAQSPKSAAPHSQTASPDASSPAPQADASRDWSSPLSPLQQRTLATVIANVKRSGHATSFANPVDPVALKIPTYPDIVKNPMDLHTMNSKVKDGQYPNVNSVVDDFDLIVRNCETFNGPHHAITAHAHKLRETFDKQMAKVPSAEVAEPPAAEKKKKITAPKAPSARRESRTASTAAAAGGARSPVAASPTFALTPAGTPLIRRDSTADGRPRREIHPPPSKDLPYNQRPKKKKYQWDLRFCQEVLKEMDKPKYNFFAAAFQRPVDPVALNIPTYHKIIKKPMDLSTIRRKLEGGEYENGKDFESDMRLLFANCFKFNVPGDMVYTWGKQLEEVFDHTWTGRNAWIQERAPDSGAQSPGSSVEADDDDEEEEEEDDEDDVGNDRISKLQQQIMAMNEELGKLKNKKSTPPAPAKAPKSSKGGKKDTKKSGTGKKDKKESKAKNTKTPYVTYEQKQDISNRINTLPENRMAQALTIIRDNMPNLKVHILLNISADMPRPHTDALLKLIVSLFNLMRACRAQGVQEDEIELDIDELSNDVLYKLLSFVRKHAPHAGDPAPEARASYVPPAAARPKKNKPMGAREQESRIAELKRLQAGEPDNGMFRAHGRAHFHDLAWLTSQQACRRLRRSRAVTTRATTRARRSDCG